MMQMRSFAACVFALALVTQSWAFESVESSDASHSHHAKKHHHHHHGHHHKGHHHGKHHNNTAEHAPKPAAKGAVSAKTVGKPAAEAKAPVPVVPVKITKDQQIVEKMKALELRLAQKKRSQAAAIQDGHLMVSGPLPHDFAQRFADGVATALGVDSKKVTVTRTSPVKDQAGVVSVDFKAPPKVVSAVETQVTDPDSKLAQGSLHSFLVAKDDGDEEEAEKAETPKDAKKEKPEKKEKAQKAKAAESEDAEATPVQEKGIDIDTAMPYGDLEPFGREDTAQELTENSVQESDGMVDQLERAEVAEEKRSVFRALTRLRGAAITSFDGVARSQTGNIDEYNKVHKWRNTHPLHHLADEESDISKWAFPDNADF